jgi:hypothetical protein
MRLVTDMLATTWLCFATSSGSASALTIPVVFWSSDVQHWLGYRSPSFPGSNLIAPILGTVVFVYGGLVFIRGAWAEVAVPGHDDSEGLKLELPLAQSAFSPLLCAAWLKIATSIAPAAAMRSSLTLWV